MDSRVALGSLLIFTFLGLLSVARRRCDGFVHREGTKDTKFGDWVSPTLRTTGMDIQTDDPIGDARLRRPPNFVLP
jgi:hypothetical protein